MSEAQTPIAAQPTEKVFERCDQCSSPVDERQRYCVACGSRNRRAEDPVAAYLAVATSRSRAATQSRSGAARRRRTAGIGTVAVIVAIPLAVALGVIVGRDSAGNSAKAFEAAIRAEKAPIVRVLGGGTAARTAPVSVTTGTVASTFSLPKGFAVELQTLPAQGTGTAAVARAEQAARGKGATSVGVINEKDFNVSPKPSGAPYVVCSGQFKTKAEADATLAKLKRHFPGAIVIAVRAVAHSSSAGASSAGSSGAGQISTHVSKAQTAQGAKEVNKISHSTGSGYVNAQNSLPGSVSVP